MPPLVITGMHRSNTSLVAKAFAAAGLNLGDRLMSGSPSNPEGYFEDLDIVSFEDDLLKEQNLAYGNWHVFSRDQLNKNIGKEWYERGRSLVDKKLKLHDPFGWKSPRSVLFLDFWKTVYPQAKFVFIFRHPALVLKSLLKRGDMKRHSRLWPLQVTRCIQMWIVYNEIMIDFYEKQTNNCFLLEAPQSLNDPIQIKALNNTLSENWEYELSPIEFTTVVNPKLLNTKAGKINDFMVALSSKAMVVYKRLRELTQKTNA